MKGLLIKNALMMKRTLFLYALLIVVLSFGNDSGLLFALGNEEASIRNDVYVRGLVRKYGYEMVKLAMM